MGRFKNVPLESRACLCCNQGSVGDESHFLTNCPALAEEGNAHYDDLNVCANDEDTDIMKIRVEKDALKTIAKHLKLMSNKEVNSCIIEFHVLHIFQCTAVIE